MMKKTSALFVGLLLSFNSFAADQTLDKVIAIVNDQPLTQSEFNTAMEITVQQLGARRTQLPEKTILQKQVLDSLIAKELQLQLAQQMQMTASEEEINQTLANIAKKNNVSVEEMANTITAEGLDYKEYKIKIGEQVLLNKIQQRAISHKLQVSELEITTAQKQYNKDREENIDYRIEDILIALPSEPTSEQLQVAQNKGKRILKEIKAGKTFRAIAIEESDAPNALEGGDLGWRPATGLPEIFFKAVQTLKAGQNTKIIRAPNGLHVLKLAEKRYRNKPMTKDQIQNAIVQRKADENLQLWLQDLRAGAFISIVNKPNA